MTQEIKKESLIPDSESEMVIREQIERLAKSIITDIMSGVSRYMGEDGQEWIGWYDYHCGRFRELDNLVRTLSRNEFYLDKLGKISEVTY